jgi:hypothetical protein
MSNLNFSCPHCGESTELTEALAGPLLAAERQKAAVEAERRLTANRQAFESAAAAKARDESAAEIAALTRAAAAKDAEIAKARQAELAARTAIRQAEEAQQNVDVEVSRRAAEQVQAAVAKAREDAAAQYSKELANAQSEISEKNAKLAVAQEAEIEARRAKREAEEAKREADTLVERRLDDERKKAREAALRERDTEHHLTIADKDRQLGDLREKLDEARRKADQGPQQQKGDVLELDLYEALRGAFPGDNLERIAKGQRGGDLIQTVRSSSGLACGRIKWEGKRTQNWSDAWLPKLRDDQRAYKCDLAAIVTETLPDGIAYFDVIDDVWVSGIVTALSMAAALRRGLIETATARRAVACADSKKDIVFGYLTGLEFRARVRGIVDPLIEMRSGLDSEKRAAARQFAARDKQLERMELSLSGMYGDLQGIVGPSLPRVEGLLLAEPEPAQASDLDRNGDPDDREVA